ncbi:condensation domain-containing protein [Pseudoalteromonas sp. SMS1]|uniref:condensation domain-containing protein n=1 Tax=Pseudoalteromonas sp. SMS1 TaxID=2908894 RepID=UPI001F38C221|nr:condensation domain-containing protein [Pseudoalteromonas sp. SMS1]MCF2858800.1 condensation domain-containing protein [Pseudoalteromonas sp. SMS1]
MKNIPITLLQNMMLSFCTSLPELPIANVGGVIRFENIDAQRLINAQREIMHCHQSFKFYFQRTAQGIVQHEHSEQDLNFTITDFSGLSDELALKNANETITRLFTTPINPFDFPLHRNEVLVLPNNQVWLVFLANHVICDGYSAFAYLRQIVEYYDKGIRPQCTFIDPEKLAHAQRSYLESEQYKKDKGFWLSQLSKPISFRLFSQANKPKSQSLRFTLPRQTFGPLIELASRHSLSLSTLLLTLWQRQLNEDYPLSDSNRLRIGLPVHGRKKNESDLIIFKANMLVHEFELEADANLVEQAKNVAAQLKRAYRHKRLPPELLYDDLNMPSYMPLSEFRFGYLELEKLSEQRGLPMSFSYESHLHHSLPLQLNIVNFHGVDHIDFLIEYNPANLNEFQVEAHINSLFEKIKRIATENEKDPDCQ